MRRRHFGVVLLVAIALFCTNATSSFAVVQIPLPGENIPKYVEPLFVPPVIDATTGAPYTITMTEFPWQVLPAPNPAAGIVGFPPTMVWGYNNSYPGPTVVAKRGVPAWVTYNNNIINPLLLQYLAVDQTLHWADPLGLNCMMNPANPACFLPYNGPVPVSVHLHGGEVPAAFDGGPDSWFTPGLGITGPGFVTNVFNYPNGQEPTSMFYHDHALGVTRLNVFAGLAAFYLVTGTPGVDEPLNLPSASYDIGLAIQDRMFDTNGQWFFPNLGINPTVHPFWIPEFFGDAILVNGKTWPFLNVEPRRYRFHLLNGSNARFYTLSIVQDAGAGKGIGNRRGPIFYQIGSDGGYLDLPVPLTQLTIAPGERADVIVDFSGFAGATLVMTNSAKAPFPNGAPPDPKTVGQIMQFRVVLPLASIDTSCNPALGQCARPTPIVNIKPAPGTVPVRRLTLNEVMGPGGPLEVLLNNTKWSAPYTENPRVGATEIWEIINLTADTHPIHLHLVQFQLVNRQNIQTGKYLAAYDAAFPGGAYIPASGPPMPYGACYDAAGNPIPGAVCGGNPDPTPFLMGAPLPPDPNETGWKDTFRMNPGQITRVAVRWAPQDAPVAGTPCPLPPTPPQPNCVPSAGVNLYPFDPTTFPGYVWHCHIIDHEDNEMMRPYPVLP